MSWIPSIHSNDTGPHRSQAAGGDRLVAREPRAMSNDNEYGLAAAVWTNDVKKAMLTARALRAGVVRINDSQPAPTEMPWGGYKQSGIGGELGKHGVEDFLESKSVYRNLA